MTNEYPMISSCINTGHDSIPPPSVVSVSRESLPWACKVAEIVFQNHLWCSVNSLVNCSKMWYSGTELLNIRLSRDRHHPRFRTVTFSRDWVYQQRRVREHPSPCSFYTSAGPSSCLRPFWEVQTAQNKRIAAWYCRQVSIYGNYTCALKIHDYWTFRTHNILRGFNSAPLSLRGAVDFLSVSSITLRKNSLIYSLGSLMKHKTTFS